MIFHAAVDDRVAFAATSGAAGTYRGKLAAEVGIERAEVIPGVVDAFDIDDLTRLIAPRPLGTGSNDRYALDADSIARTTRAAYRDVHAQDRLHVDIAMGEHALTEERSLDPGRLGDPRGSWLTGRTGEDPGRWIASRGDHEPRTLS